MAKQYGFIDKSGKVLIEPQFDDVEAKYSSSFWTATAGVPFREGLAQVEKDAA